MSSPRPPIPPPEPPEFEPVYINPIEPEKRIKEGYPEKDSSEAKKQKMLGFVSFLNYLKAMLQTAMKKGDSKLNIDQELGISKNLRLFKAQMEKLKEKDESENSHYAQALTDLWNLLLIEYELVKSVESTYSQTLRTFKILINEFNAYPPKEEHSLGFYLTHYAGETWFPFPFMDILKNLHLNYSEKLEHSDLVHLIDRIDDLLKLFTSLFPKEELPNNQNL